MKHINIISVGTRTPGWIQNGCQEYQKRLQHELTVKLHEIQMPRRSKNEIIGKLLEKEAGAILKDIPESSHVIALDEKGQKFSTTGLSAELDRLLKMEKEICFIIGGPDGLHPSVKKRADMVWSLSDLTLPHMLVRVVLVEQIYRAWCILKSHPYHRG